MKCLISMNVLIDGNEHTPTCVFAHGAGAPMDSEFMERITSGLVDKGIRVVRFEFPYMQERRSMGKKRPPNRQPELITCFRQVIDEVNGPCALMGKSMGARMASILASQATNDSRILGVLALGYPFHPQGKPEKLRTDHLVDIQVPMMIMQGTRDALGNKELVSSLTIPSAIRINWLEDGDHDLKPRVKSGLTHDQHIKQAISQCAEFIKQCY